MTRLGAQRLGSTSDLAEAVTGRSRGWIATRRALGPLGVQFAGATR